MGPLEEDYIETVLTCEGDFYDPEFHTQLKDFSNRLQDLIATEEKQRLIIKKVEPWNSVRVTFNIPKEAAIRLKHLAEQGDQTLRQLGVLAVQIEGDRVISLTFAGKNNETTEVVFHTNGPGAAAAGVNSMFDVSGSDEPGPSNVEATRKNIAHYLSQQGGAGNIFDSILNHGASNEKSHGDPMHRVQFPFGSPNRSPSGALGVQVPFPAGRSPTSFPSPSTGQLQQSFPSPSSGRSHMSPGSPKFSTTPPQILNPNSPNSRQGQQANFPLPFPHGNPNVNNLQRLVAAGGKDITSSSPLLVNLLQSDVAAGHFNNLPQHRSPFPFEPTGPAVKRRRRARKSKDGSPKVPKLGEGDEAIVPLPGTFPGISSQPQMENRVPPMGTEAAQYNVPISLAGNAVSEGRAGVASPSGAQVHTPPLVERSHGNQGGPLSNQVSPNSSGTLSVSTPSPIRTTPERSLGNSGMQQIINPYTGQLEPVENSPSERIPTKPESSGDNSALDVPPQLHPPPNPLVALESRLAAGSQNLSLPSQLPSSPRSVDSPVTKGISNPAQVTNAAGTMVSSTQKTAMPPVCTTDSMQSKMTLPVSIPSVPPNGRAAIQTTMHNGPEIPPSSSSLDQRRLASNPALPSTAANLAHHQGPTDMHSIPRHPQVHQHGHPVHHFSGIKSNVAESVGGTASSDMRHVHSGMGHPELRLRMPQHHQTHMPLRMVSERHGVHYPAMPRSQGPGVSGVPSLPMHNADSGVATGRAVLAGHQRMVHPQHPHPMPPGYYQHMQQQRARLPITNTVSATHIMTSNNPLRLSHAPPGTSNSVIASQLMRPTLAAGTSLGMSTSTATLGSAQMTHPAIASQLSQNNSSTPKVPLPVMDSKSAASSSLAGENVSDSSTTQRVTSDITESEQQPTTTFASVTNSPKDGESDKKSESSKPQESKVDDDSVEHVSKSHQNPDSESGAGKISSVSDTSTESKAAAHETVSSSEVDKPTTAEPSQSDEPVKSDSVQVSSQVTNSIDSVVDAVGTEGIDKSDVENKNKDVGAIDDSELTCNKSVSEVGKSVERVEKTSDKEAGVAQIDESDKDTQEVGKDTVIREEEARSNSSSTLELAASVPSGSHDSDSPPTTSSPGDSDTTPMLENYPESKLSDVGRLQQNPLHARTTMSAMAIHNDLHNLVRGSNGASTGEASPVSDNLSSTSQQNYGQSPLGNSVGLHMNHDSELSSQSFDDNSSTPPHAQVVAGPTLATTPITRETNDDGATKSKDNSHSPSKESLPKDQPAASVPETKNIITVGYAVSNEPILTKEFSDGPLSSSKSLDDIPYLKKPSVDLGEGNETFKGVPLSGEYLDEKSKQTETVKSSTEESLSEKVSKDSLNYRGQVPLFSRTMETCDLNPGGTNPLRPSATKFPVNGDAMEVQADSATSAIISDTSSARENHTVPQESDALHPKPASSSSSRDLKDADVPGESVDMHVSSEKEKTFPAVKENKVSVETLENETPRAIDSEVPSSGSNVPTGKEEVTDSAVTKVAVLLQKNAESTSLDVSAKTGEDAGETEGKGDAEDCQERAPLTKDDYQLAHDVAASCPELEVTADTSVIPTKKETVEQEPVQQSSSPAVDQSTSSPVDQSASSGTATSVEASESKMLAGVKGSEVTTLQQNVSVGKSDKIDAGASLLAVATKSAHEDNTNDSNNVDSSASALLKPDVKANQGDKSTSEKGKAQESVIPKKESTAETGFLVDKKGDVVPEKSADDNQPSSCQNTQSPLVSMATTQLSSLTKTIENKLSVAVVSNGPPTITTAIMTKSISPVIKAVSSSKPADMVTGVSVASTLTVTMNTSLPSSESVANTSSVSLSVRSTVVSSSLLSATSSAVGTVSKALSLPVMSSSALQYQKVTPHNDIKYVAGTVTTQTDRQPVPAIPLSPAKSIVRETNQSQTATTVPMQAKVCIVTTVGNTKVAIHTLNSIAEPGNIHRVATTQKVLSKSNLIQSAARVQNAVGDVASKGSAAAATSIMIRDITKADSKVESCAPEISQPKLERIPSRVQSGVVLESSGQSKHLSPNTGSHVKHVEKHAAQSSKVVHYNLHHGQLNKPATPVVPVVGPRISVPRDGKNALQEHIDSIVNASRSTSQISSVAGQHPGATSVNCNTPISLSQGKVVAPNLPGTIDSRIAQVAVTGRSATGQILPTARSGLSPVTSNLDGGTATAAIQAVAAHVKATQGAASQSSVPAEQHKRPNQSKGISILKPLYDREFELDDNEMDPKVPVPQIPVLQRKTVGDTQAIAKKSEDTGASHSKTAIDNTAHSIAQILDHAKRAMAEEKQQKESKAAALKDKSKGTSGKTPKVVKPLKAATVNKVTPQTVTAGTVGGAKAHDLTNIHLSNFVQKSKQTPAVVNSTAHTAAHPITAPEFHLNLTESVQKVMQAIPGSDALSPPPGPPKVVRPVSVFTKFGEDKTVDQAEPVSGSVSSTAVTTAVTTMSSPASDSVSQAVSAPVILHKASPNIPTPSSAISPVPSLSPGNRTAAVTSPHKTPPVALPTRKTPTPPAAMSALRNTPTPPAAVVPSTQQVVARKTPTPPAATVPPSLMRKAPTPPAAVSQSLGNVKVVSPHNAVSRNTPTPPFNRNTPTPPGTSTVIHSRSPHSTPPAKEIPKVKGAGVKFEIMPQPHGASTIVVIKSDNKDPTPPPTSDATQTIILGHKDIIRKTAVSSGKADNVTVITTHKAEALRKAAPTIIVPSSATAPSTSAITLSHLPIHKQSTAPIIATRGQQGQWKRADLAVSPIRGVAPPTAQISRITPVMRNVALQGRLVQPKPITAITVVNPAKQMILGTTVATLGTTTTMTNLVSTPKVVASETALSPKQPGSTVTTTASPVRVLVTTVKPAAVEVNSSIPETDKVVLDVKPEMKSPKAEDVRVVKPEPLKPQRTEPTKTEAKIPEAEEVRPIKIEDVKVAAHAASQISPKMDSGDHESKAAVRKTNRKRSAEKETEKVEVEPEQPNNNNKNEKTAKKSGDAGHTSDETPRPARVTRRRSRESTESQQSTANSESSRSARSSRRRGASESSDVSISSDGHTDLRSTPSARSSVDRSESPPRTSRHSTRSTTRKRTSAEREDSAQPVSTKAAYLEKERSISPAPGKGTRASKRKLVLEEAADDESKKAKVDTVGSGQCETSRPSEPSESDHRSRRTGAKSDVGKTPAAHSMKEPVNTPNAKRTAGRSHKVESVEAVDDHTYSGTRRTNTRSCGNALIAESKEDAAQKKIATTKKDEKVNSRTKGKQTAGEEKGAATEDTTDTGAKRSTRSTRNKDRTELPPPPATKRQRSARDH